ncbi:DUF5682 family protein [Deinococcus peraridilitoris]|uniref:Uncharacterized protein n=1 Tax=Deinococcus peraridilitoris (strain DSM 19664 / LMG 22246 / CIP 109416 / KR-200) TaxID=937777 RepID=L0A2Q5_DEIPD|nr:DUF5682 family protein [Deinococcus peraridilitoris]AFZ67724.1 hypothetical protein Deipe_2240 [Deinococcus peraridilitoris DSM 19664]
MSTAHIFGIRHHGPGSARSLRRALEELQPDLVLVEGPPDADALLPLLAHEEMQLPAALLIYAADEPGRAVYYPFADFSPETVAIRHALSRALPVWFMDLPVSHSLAWEARIQADLQVVGREAGEAPREVSGNTPQQDATDLPLPDSTRLLIRRDPLSALAEAAGFTDGERWWEFLVESRGGNDSSVFEAITEAMKALREEVEAPGPEGAAFSWETHLEECREAHMRQTLRAAQKEGFSRIAVVCGAWHAPALQGGQASTDARLLKTLPKIKVRATWVPWTHGRLARESGYGAGVDSPGWYQHLFGTEGDVLAPWMTRTARLLREEGLDASSASVIEAVRLAGTLATLRGQALPGLQDVTEAARAVFCWDSDLPMRLIHERLVVGETLGRVPQDTPAVPLAQHLAAEQKRLRLKPEALARDLDLDLRKDTDLERSALLHRLHLLGVAWGEERRVSGARGTFREAWRLQWHPEFALRLIEASLWGQTVGEAAEACAAERARHEEKLPKLTALLDQVILAALPGAARLVLRQLSGEAANASDVTHLMQALPPLARVMRYGDVRGTDSAQAGEVFRTLLVRACIGLPPACASLDDDAAGEMRTHLGEVHAAVTLLQHEEHTASWTDALHSLATLSGGHGLIHGRATRLLLDLGELNPADVEVRLKQALAGVNPPSRVAAWLEGFLEGSGLVLVHDARLLGLIDDWLVGLSGDAFQEVLPLLRRTFTRFPAPERRTLGERIRSGEVRALHTRAEELDAERAALVLPVVAQLLGLEVMA